MALALSRATTGAIGLILLAGSLLMLWFIILAGVPGADVTPFKHTYFLRASTQGIAGARDASQWTYFYVCGPENTDCGAAVPALPLGRAWSPGAQNLPEDLAGSHDDGRMSAYYYYMWRFGWVFFLLALLFEVLAFFSGFVACCGRLGSAMSGLVSGAALVFLTVAVTLMTATFVKLRNAFHSAGRDASLGRYAFGFAWAAWAALLISAVLFFSGVRKRETDMGVDGAGAVSTKRRFVPSLGRKKSAQSRMATDMGSKRVKEEYP